MEDEQEAVQKEKEVQSKSRRAFIFGATTATIGTAALSHVTVKVLDELYYNKPTLPTGKVSDNPIDWFNYIFGDLSYFSAYAGRENVDYLEKDILHPDILSPFKKILPLWNQDGFDLIPTKFIDLPTFDRRQPIILIGGPVSNVYSRFWQGYEQNPHTKIYEQKKNYIRRRWVFRYGDEKGPTRYLSGKLHSSWKQEIVDQKENKILKPIVNPKDGLLIQDYLLVNFVPNLFSQDSGTSILDSADLHGLGNDAFSELLNSPIRMKELVDILAKKNVRPGEHFQALYKVQAFHDHDSRQTTRKEYYLYDVEKVESKG